MRDIAKKSNTQYILNKYHLKASKKYGQNFLIDLNIIKKIASIGQLDKETCVIEIGPGIGALTEQLALLAGQVICYEIDTRLKDVLHETLEEYQNINIVFQDFLTVDIKKVVLDLKKQYKRVCVVANLPYYITSDILEYLITSGASIDSVHTMVQKEVALKLTDKSYRSPLTYMIESIGYITMDMVVPRTVFDPSPHVDSAIISIYYQHSYPQELTHILKRAFTQKRKTIYNNLKNEFENTREVLAQCHIKETLRPEQLTIEDYLRLIPYSRKDDEE